MPWWREPLLQCVVIGAALFAGYEVWFAAPDKSADTIRVTEQQLIRFIEQRTKAFDETTARRRLDAMDTDARTALIEDYVREEAQYRTATQWGLAEDDYVIRRRLVQQVAFVAEGTPSGEIDTQELQVFFRAHRDRYAEPERITLTHVFLHNADDAQTRARALLSTLNDNAITPNQATQYGERFAYANHVAERSAAELEAILGPQVRAAALKVPVDTHTMARSFALRSRLASDQRQPAH